MKTKCVSCTSLPFWSRFITSIPFNHSSKVSESESCIYKPHYQWKRYGYSLRCNVSEETCNKNVFPVPKKRQMTHFYSFCSFIFYEAICSLPSPHSDRWRCKRLMVLAVDCGMHGTKFYIIYFGDSKKLLMRNFLSVHFRFTGHLNMWKLQRTFLRSRAAFGTQEDLL